NLFGLVKFFQKALGQGIKPIIGVDLRIVDPDDPARPDSLVLLCQNRDGYRNLSRLVTRSYLEGQQRGVPMVHREWLEAPVCEGLIALSGPGSDIGRALVKGHAELADARLRHWQAVFDGRLYLELTRAGRRGDEDHLQHALTLAHERGVPVVASNDVRFLES